MPKKQLYEGKRGATIVCPDCLKAFVGEPFPMGKDILTLPHHFKSIGPEKTRTLRSQRLLSRRKIDR